MTEPFRMGRVAGHTAIYTAGTLLRSAVSFVMLPVYTRYLTPADYGVLELIELTLDVVSIMAGARLAVGVFRFYHKAATEHEKRLVVSTALVLLTATYAACATATFVAAPVLAGLVLRSRAEAQLIRIGAAAFALNSMLIVPLAYLRVRERSKLFVSISALKLVIQLGLNIALVVQFRMGVKGILLSDLLSNVVVGGVLAFLTAREVGLGVSRAAARDLVRFGLPLMATQVATFISTFGDRFFLRALTDLTVVGLYSLAYKFGFLLGALGAVPFASIWEPVRFEVAKRPDRDELYSRAFLYLNVLLVTMAVVIVLFVGDVLRMIATPAFQRAADIVPVILMAYILQAWSGIQDIGIMVREQTRYVAWANWIAALVVLVGYALLIPPLGGLGAALATVLSFGVRHVLIYRFSQKLWPVRYQWKPVWLLLALGAVAWAAGLAIPHTGLVSSLTLRMGLLVGYGCGVWYLGILPQADRLALRRMLRAPRAL